VERRLGSTGEPNPPPHRGPISTSKEMILTGLEVEGGTAFRFCYGAAIGYLSRCKGKLRQIRVVFHLESELTLSVKKDSSLGSE